MAEAPQIGEEIATQIGTLITSLSAGVGAMTEGGSADAKNAAAALARLAKNAANQVAIAEAGGIAPLVELARGGSEGAKTWALLALANLATSSANQVAIAEAGGIAPLVELAHSGSAGAKTWAALALANLATNSANKVAIAKAAVGALVELVRGGSADAAGALRILATNNATNQVAIAAAGGIAPLVELVRGGSAGAKQQAAGALRNLASENAANTAAIAAEGGVAPLEQLARDGERNATECVSEVLAMVRPAVEALRKQKEAVARSERWKAERVAAGVDHHMRERPKEHFCSITLEVLTDPVTAADGMTYECAAIERWLRGSHNSPSTGAALPHQIVVPNQALKNIIRDWEGLEHERCMAMAPAT